MVRFLIPALLLASFSAGAIVIRDDVNDAKYRISPEEFPALADLPGEGHGVLIAPTWVITAAHAVSWQPAIHEVTIAGVSRGVARVVVHPGYQKPAQALVEHALATWDWTLFRVVLATSDDLALIELKEPVVNIAPAVRDRSGDEFDQTIQIIGKGATGNGLTGFEFDSAHRTQLRRAYNRLSSTDGRWFCYVFNPPADGLPLEGGSGSGDSGGPVLIQRGEEWLLAGLTSWVDPQSNVRKPGRYGQISCNVRLRHYRDWINGVLATKP